MRATLLLAFVTLAGCNSSSTPSNTSLSTTKPATSQPTSAPSPSTRPATRDTADVPVLYSAYASPSKLTDAARERIVRTAIEHLPEGSPGVWYIMVDANNWSLFGGRHQKVRAHYLPIAISPRLRKVPTLMLTPEYGGEPYAFTEFQVSPEEKPFDDLLAIPATRDLPFRVSMTRDGKPVEMDNDTLVGLVDFVRALSRAKRSPILVTPGTRPGESKFRLPGTQIPVNEPILSITGDGDRFRVETGWVAGNLSGVGHAMEVRRKGDGFEQVGGVSFWRS